MLVLFPVACLLVYYTWVMFHKHLHVVFVHLTDLELKSRPSVDSVSSTPQKFEKSEHS